MPQASTNNQELFANELNELHEGFLIRNYVLWIKNSYSPTSTMPPPVTACTVLSYMARQLTGFIK